MAAGQARQPLYRHLQMNSQNSEVESLNVIDFRLPVSKHKNKHGFNEASLYKA